MRAVKKVEREQRHQIDAVLQHGAQRWPAANRQGNWRHFFGTRRNGETFFFYKRKKKSSLLSRDFSRDIHLDKIMPQNESNFTDSKKQAAPEKLKKRELSQNLPLYHLSFKFPL